MRIGPEARRANHDQGESARISRWRPEPTDGAISGDELWLEVKSLSSLVIAGSPRNAFRGSVIF